MMVEHGIGNRIEAKCVHSEESSSAVVPRKRAHSEVAPIIVPQERAHSEYLKTLPYSVGLLLSLVKLGVNYNKITSLPDSIGCLKKLQKLSLKANPLALPPLDVVEQGLYAMKEYLAPVVVDVPKEAPTDSDNDSSLASGSDAGSQRT
ncbi:hypothetical protein Fmac_011205 [Flemingia macrophylla]|uniref:Uncharacterized protein n=1 Tax=Flemingia macrophylla TaxID=520843 RepID=A0ABD1MLS8_9FABA